MVVKRESTGKRVRGAIEAAKAAYHYLTPRSLLCTVGMHAEPEAVVNWFNKLLFNAFYTLMGLDEHDLQFV